MKSTQLKIQKPCTENWDKMSPTERGRFCEQCSKNVVDLTFKKPQEIYDLLKENHGNMCGRVRSAQLQYPMLEQELHKGLSLPYGKTAAGLMIAASVLSVDEVHAQSGRAEMVKTEISKNAGSGDLEINQEATRIGDNEDLPICPVKMIRGQITTQETGKPIAHAKVSLVTVDKVYSTYTDLNGMYTLNLPENVMGAQNIIAFSFRDIVRSEGADGFDEFYESAEVLVAKEDFSTPLNHEAEQEIMMLGGMGLHRPNEEPLVYYNGQQIEGKELYDLRFDYSKGLFFSLNSEMAEALLGKKGKYGARLFFDGDVLLE